MGSFRKFLVGRIVNPLVDKKNGSRRLQRLRELEGFQWQPPEAIEERRWSRVKQLLEHAYRTVPYYRQLFDAHGVNIDALVRERNLSAIPILRKSTVRTHDLRSSDYDPAGLRTSKTGGSTGVPLKLFFTPVCEDYRNAAEMMTDGWAGVRLGDKRFAVWGNPVRPKGFKQHFRARLINPTVFLDTMNLSPETLREGVRAWNEEGCDFIFGHSHSIYQFAEYVLRQGHKVKKPKAIMATSMMLLAHERERIEQAFGAPVFDRYGCEEVGLIASECAVHRGMHLNAEDLILEVVDDQGNPLPPGQTGKVVVTDLNNLAMPLIRYQNEDMAALLQEPCSCGRSLPLISKPAGRIADFLKRPDGSLVAGVSLIERTLTAIAGISQMQIIQEQLKEIRINLVANERYDARAEQKLRDEFWSVFGPEVRVTINPVEMIQQEPNGKFRFSICKV